MMSNPIEMFLKESTGSQGQQPQQNQPSEVGQAKPVVETLPTPPSPPTAQPLPSAPSGQIIIDSILNQLNRLTLIEKAIIASALGFEEPLKSISPEEWVKLIEERVGKYYADAFRKWVSLKGCGGEK
ncbi:hypothetical protein JCM14467A_00380 [Vulcanisaeta sp. JCM 14467]